jgi:hypothetical protein
MCQGRERQPKGRDFRFLQSDRTKARQFRGTLSAWRREDARRRFEKCNRGSKQSHRAKANYAEAYAARAINKVGNKAEKRTLPEPKPNVARATNMEQEGTSQPPQSEGNRLRHHGRGQFRHSRHQDEHTSLNSSKWGIYFTQVTGVSRRYLGAVPAATPGAWSAHQQAHVGVRRDPGGPPHEACPRATT